jgi:hypothetical protein
VLLVCNIVTSSVTGCNIVESNLFVYNTHLPPYTTSQRVTTLRCPLLRCGNRISEGKIRFTPLLWCKSLISAILYNFSYKRSAIAVPKQHNNQAVVIPRFGILKRYTDKIFRRICGWKPTELTKIKQSGRKFQRSNKVWKKSKRYTKLVFKTVPKFQI